MHKVEFSCVQGIKRLNTTVAQWRAELLKWKHVALDEKLHYFMLSMCAISVENHFVDSIQNGKLEC